MAPYQEILDPPLSHMFPDDNEFTDDGWLVSKYIDFLSGKKFCWEKNFYQKKSQIRDKKVQESDEIDQNLANKVTN